MWVLLGDTSHLFPSVTDSFLVVTLKGPDIQSGWAFITGFLLLSCSGGKPAWFHPSEAFRHALHCCISVLSALKKRDYMIHLALLPLFIYHWRSPCGVCPHNKDQLQMSAPNAKLASAIQGVCRDNSQLWSKPSTFHPLSCPEGAKAFCLL